MWIHTTGLNTPKSSGTFMEWIKKWYKNISQNRRYSKIVSSPGPSEYNARVLTEYQNVLYKNKVNVRSTLNFKCFIYILQHWGVKNQVEKEIFGRKLGKLLNNPWRKLSGARLQERLLHNIATRTISRNRNWKVVLWLEVSSACYNPSALDAVTTTSRVDQCHKRDRFCSLL